MLNKLLKSAYLKGLDKGFEIGYQAAQKNGAIVPGVDIQKEVEKSLNKRDSDMRQSPTIEI
jgi:hypothetical protein